MASWIPSLGVSALRAQLCAVFVSVDCSGGCMSVSDVFLKGCGVLGLLMSAFSAYEATFPCKVRDVAGECVQR